VFKHLLELLRTTVLPSTSQPPYLLKIIKYTFNFTDKSVLTSLSLFFNSGLLFTVLLLFSYSTCLLCVLSSVILLCFCSVHHVALLLFSFCTVPSQFAIPLLIFFFLLFTHFSFRTINQIRSIAFSFIHFSLTIPLPLSMGEPTTSVLATETLTDSSFPVGFP
jgi:hypothetical protein